jgi:predicted cupin superfamily sugar epimerase
MDTQEFINRLITELDLQPLAFEGGLYVQTYKSNEAVPQAALPERYHSPRSFGTAILYLLTDHPDSFSAMHRLLTDEVYHFYLGDPVEMLLLYPDGNSQQVLLGQDIMAGQKVQFVAPAGVWQGSHLLPGGEYALIGTTMAPGFEYEDFTNGARAVLLNAYPSAHELICQLTRTGQA